MKLACIGPVSPLKTGIAYFNERLLPFFAKDCSVYPFTDRSLMRGPDSDAVRVPDISEFLAEQNRFDVVLYHMGNHYRYHRRIYETLLRAPGFVVFHDCILTHFFSKYYLERGNFEAFRKALATHPDGEPDGEAGRFFRGRSDLYRFSMAGVVALASRGAIVMSEYGKGILNNEAPPVPVLKIQFPYFDTPDSGCDSDFFRSKYGIPSDHFLVTSIGHITPAKRMDVATAAFRKFHQQFPKSLFLMAGESSAHSPLEREGDSAHHMRCLGYLDRPELDCLMNLSDVCINLRYPSQGEMSSTLIDMLGRGKVVAVSNYAQFAEFPDEICIKVNLGMRQSDELADALLSFATNRSLAQTTGCAAAAYVAEHHQPNRAAGAMLKFMQEHVADGPVLSTEFMEALLEPDKAPARYVQALAYNFRRALSYVRQEGMGRLLREGVRRMAEKRD